MTQGWHSLHYLQAYSVTEFEFLSNNTQKSPHTYRNMRRWTNSYHITKNYWLPFLQHKVYYLSKLKNRICVDVHYNITLPVMHDLHCLKTKILPHANCEHIKDMFSLQPANQHNNSYKENSCHNKYKAIMYCSLTGKRTLKKKSVISFSVEHDSIIMTKMKKVFASQVAQPYLQ